MSRTFRKNRTTGRRERDTYNRETHAASSCQHHGGCPWCESNRTINSKKAPPIELPWEDIQDD